MMKVLDRFRMAPKLGWVLLLSVGSGAFAQGLPNTEEFLEKFSRSNLNTENKKPPISEMKARARFELWKRFSLKPISSSMRGSEIRSLDGFKDNEARLLAGFLGNEIAVSKLSEMSLKELESGKVDVQPWSAHYWPFYQGALSHRYSDSKVPEGDDWKAYRDYFSEVSFDKLSSSIDSASPAEKYSLLVGDMDFNLATYNWGLGEEYFNRDKKVETWMGLCHGWAPAAYVVPRPRQALSVASADGRWKFKFYPDDIKGLVSLLWANGNFNAHFLGARCFEKKPGSSDSGHITNPSCFDINPALWHQVIVNKIGLGKKSFVFDVNYSEEVWNQPILSYSYSYFNPKTKKKTKTLAAATVQVGNFSEDGFKETRTKRTESIVGIAMDLSYINETDPSSAEVNSEEKDSVKTVRYFYDLELDSEGRMVGGEWYQKEHPDFVWTPYSDSKMSGPLDKIFYEKFKVGDWSPQSSFSKDWTPLAAEGAAYGQLLEVVVRGLVLESATR